MTPTTNPTVHDAEVSEVLTELALEYWPGITFIEEVTE